MKFEKRSGGGEETPAPAPEEKPSAGNKPVVIYIMILFIVAFLLMALSFLMHQRSNSEVLGELQDSVNAMQEVQATQEKIIELQEEIASLEDENAALQEELESETASSGSLLVERDTLERQYSAMLTLYQLQQLYAARDYEGCQDLITDFETGLADSLPQDALDGGVVSPAQRYQELKAAVEARTG